MRPKAKFVLRKSVMLSQYTKLEAVSDRVSYSFKSNLEVGKLLEQLTDCDFSVHSHKTLELIKDRKRVWLFAQAWDEDEISELMRNGVSRFVVDNSKDLDMLTAFLHKTGKKAELLIRMRLKEHTIHTGKHFVYGMPAEEINSCIKRLKQDPNITVLGIHFHRKTQNISEWGLKDELSQTLSPDTLASISILNIGGGFPVDYKNSRATTLRNIFDEAMSLKAWLNEKGVKLIVEPGRFIAAPCIELHTTIRRIYCHNIVVDCSVYNAAIDTFIAHVRLRVRGEGDEGDAYTIKGSTPDSVDILRYRVFLKDPKEGDTLIFENAGAYNFAWQFCGLEPLPTEVVE